MLTFWWEWLKSRAAFIAGHTDLMLLVLPAMILNISLFHLTPK